MKRILTLLAAILFVSVYAFGQPEKSHYWVVETNAQDKSYSIVRFYDQANLLVHEVKLDNIHLDVRKHKYQRKLNQLLKDYQDRVTTTSKKHKSKRSI